MGYELKMMPIIELKGTLEKAKELLMELLEKYKDEETRADIEPAYLAKENSFSTIWVIKFWHGKKIWKE